MCLKPALLASAVALGMVTTSRAQAEVVYTVFNPVNHFTLFVYDSPEFITIGTMVGVAQLAFAKALFALAVVHLALSRIACGLMVVSRRSIIRRQPR
jgi:hypothetical protein